MNNTIKNLVGWFILGVIAIVAITEVWVIGNAIYHHATEHKKEVAAVDYSDSALLIGSYWIINQNNMNNWSISK